MTDPTQDASDAAMAMRPQLSVENTEAIAAVHAFVGGLQAGHDHRDAETLNQQFASDVAWGTPYGALVDGYDTLHEIHTRFQQHADPASSVRYEVRRVQPVGDDIVIAHVARLVLGPAGRPVAPSWDLDEPFSELAMFVLVRRDGAWWLAAGQHTPMRPGGAVAATTSLTPG